MAPAPSAHNGGDATGAPVGITPTAGRSPTSHRSGKPSSLTKLPEFQIEWKNVLRVTPVTTTGKTEAEAAAAARADKPMLVYIFGDDPKAGRDPRLVVEDHKVFRDERIAVGTRFYACYRIHKLDAKRDRALKKYANRAPCLVLLRPDYKPTKCVRMKWTVKKVYAAMDVTLDKDFENCIHCAHKSRKEIQLRERRISELRAKAAKDPKAADRLATEKAALEARKRELFELQPKKT